MTQRMKVAIWALLLALPLAGYYSFLAEKLPHAAGPDELAHLRAAAFIYDTGRLAVYPDDKDALHYSPYGATRSFRPPLVYIASASVHHLTDKLGIELEKPLRQGNALLGALCALFLFLALYTYTERIGLAVVVTAAFALMPQVAFVFCYLNADGAAYMAASLILLSISVLLKKGVSGQSLALFGVACGVLSLCKVTAWVFCLPLCIFAVVFILKSRAGIVKPLLVVAVAFALTGGWRIASNVYHHGFDNPFNLKVEAELQEEKRRILPEDIVTYEDQGAGYLDLLADHDNFMSKTYLSFVGHLDWLRLPLGPIQYGAYGIVLLLGLVAWIFVLLKPALFRDYKKSERWFELSIIAGCLLLFYMYMRFNMYYDIQTQGRYLLPAFPGYLLVLSEFAGYLFSGRFDEKAAASSRAPVFAAALLIVAYVHAQALYKYVIPFYFNSAYVDTSPERFRPIPFTDADMLETGDLELLVRKEGLMKYRVTGPDPRIMFKKVRINTAPEPILLRMRLASQVVGFYSIYWDAGRGMSEQTMVRGFVPHGVRTCYQILPAAAVAHLRLDLGRPGYELAIRELAYAPLKYRAPYNILNRLFLVRLAGVR